MKLDQRFWSKVNKDTEPGCWVWVASLQSGGYGQFVARSGDRAPTLAHRLAYEAIVGPIQKGLQIDHLCRNRACVNPEHLEPVTPTVNAARSPLHNGSKSHCKQGHRFDAANTIISRGWRVCRACHNASNRRGRAKKSRIRNNA